MNQIAELFYSIGEPYAAGLFEEPDKGYFYRHALANARYFEHLRPAPYEEGELLYPRKTKYGDSSHAVFPFFPHTYRVNFDLLESKSAEAAQIMREFHAISHCGTCTHSCPNYKRIIREGLASYRRRAEKISDGEFRDGLLVLLDGMENYIRRSCEYLRSVNAPQALIAALERVPFQSAESYYEGLVAWNILFYFDGADNLGIPDDGLIHLYRGEDLTEVIGQLYDNIDSIGTWSCTIGHQYNEITKQFLRAIKHRRRPMLELMINDETPQELWDIAVENLQSGSTNPSFYNARGIYQMLHDRFPEIPEQELRLFCGCGCTETTLQGMTRAGGTDECIPIAGIFEKYMYANLASCTTFEAFYDGLCRKLETEINALLDRVMDHYEYMAKYLPNPIRTLFTDDCIEKEKDFNAGGARYTWTQSAGTGLINVVDSLSAIRELVYEKKQFSAEEFLSLLAKEDPTFFRILKTCPCYGTDDDRVDSLASNFAATVYNVYRNKPSRGFIRGCVFTEHQHVRHALAGKHLGPTPDGRKRGDATCDSIASLRGKAVKGPTAMLKSAAKLPQHLAEGISVLNLTINRNFAGAALQSLIKSYFDLGGIQVQVTCTSVEELQDALENPEKHRDLIVRVGGYSDYFINLSPDLRKAVVERNVHEMGL